MTAAAGLSLLTCASILVYGSGRGMDLTDEIFYLVWARDPNAYALMYQPFGYLLHPLYELCRGNLQVYRLAGFAVAAGAGAMLGFSLANERQRLAFSIYGAAAALTIFFPWIVTPSYNSAANVGALLTIAGIVNARENNLARQVGGADLGAAGLCISAFAKPPLFVMSAGIIVVLAIVWRGARTRLSLVAMLVLGAALLCLFVPPTEVLPLVKRIATTQKILSLPNTPLGLPGKVIHDWAIVPPLLTLATISATVGLIVQRTPWSRWCGAVAAVLSAGYLASIIPDATDGSVPDFVGLAVVLLTAGYASVVRYQNRLPIALLLGAPAAVALGTFNNQWAQLTYSMAFPFLALFLCASADPARWRRVVVSAVAVLGPVAATVFGAFYPYGLQDSLFEQRFPVQHPITGSRILVDEDTASFIGSAGGKAKGALLIDLSGTGPGVAAALGAKSPVLSWLNPATATWPDVVWSRLSPQQREQAWFVAPVRPIFNHSAPAQWLISREKGYCGKRFDPLTFWDHEVNLEFWHPCASGERPGLESDS